MKIVRVLLLAALLLSVFSTAALASDQTVGFIQLLSRVDSKIPFSRQTTDAMQQYMPELLAAQSAGKIISFEASPRTGVLKILYHSSGRTLTVGGKTVQSRMSDAMLPASSTGQVSPQGILPCTPSFAMFIFDNAFGASCLIANSHIVGSLRDRTGRIVAVYSGDADGTGSLSGAFPWNGVYSDFVPGYSLKFQEFSTGVLQDTFSARVPAIVFLTIDMKNGILTGKTAPNKSMTVSASHVNWDAFQGTSSESVFPTSSATGAWQASFGSPSPFHKGDALSAVVNANANFAFQRDMSIPYTYCQLGGNYCAAYGFPSTPATLQIIHGGVTHNFSGTFNRWGVFSATLEDSSGAPIFLVAGDKVAATSVAQYALPNLTASLDYTNDLVTGKAPASKWFDVYLWVGGTGGAWRYYTGTDSLGNYSDNYNLGFGLDLVSGDPYTTEVYFVRVATGNTTALFSAFGP